MSVAAGFRSAGWHHLLHGRRTSPPPTRRPSPGGTASYTSGVLGWAAPGGTASYTGGVLRSVAPGGTASYAVGGRSPRYAVGGRSPLYTPLLGTPAPRTPAAATAAGACSAFRIPHSAYGFAIAFSA